MEAIEKIKSQIIDLVLTSKNQKLLEEIKTILEVSKGHDDNNVELTTEQIEMIILSESDITNNRIVSDEDLNEMDNGWTS